MYAESFVALVSLLSVHGAMAPDVSVLSLQSLPVAKYVAPTNAPVRKNADAYGMEVTARSAIVMDLGSGEVLFQKDADKRYPIASLTKLVTAMTFLDSQPKLEDEVTVLGEDNPVDSGKAVFLSHERLTKRELLRALLVGSVNMAANALARSTGDREAFIGAMNDKGRALGLDHAVFVDPVGIGSHNQASARDVATILRAALSYPEIRDTTEMNRVEMKGRLNGHTYVVNSTNLLLGSYLNKPPFRIVAAKTGSLPEAGFCLAQVTKNAAGREVAVVVLGSENHFARFQDAKALTSWAFDNFEWSMPSAAWGTVSLR